MRRSFANRYILPSETSMRLVGRPCAPTGLGDSRMRTSAPDVDLTHEVCTIHRRVSGYSRCKYAGFDTQIIAAYSKLKDM